MKHIEAFSIFLTNVVNLNPTRISTLETRAATITSFLEASTLLKEYYLDARAQGSWAIGTIIKPQANKEFDADIRVYLDEIPGWEPKDYINNIYGIFRSTELYKDMVSRKTRCITLNYAGDFHLDIIPCLETDDGYYVFDRNSNVLEATDGDGYTNWFKSQDALVGGKKLVKVVRLLKYLRDIKQTFTAKSVLLTTLLGRQIYGNELASEFSDLPTSLHTISNRLNDFLQCNPLMPTIQNPALPEENFNRHWDQDRYENFRTMWQIYTTKINDAFAETSRNESIRKWRLVFGNDFGEISETKTNNVLIPSSPTAPWTNP